MEHKWNSMQNFAGENLRLRNMWQKVHFLNERVTEISLASAMANTRNSKRARGNYSMLFSKRASKMIIAVELNQTIGLP